MYGVNPNVKQDIHNNWWLQPYFFYTIRSTNTKGNRGYEYDYSKRDSKSYGTHQVLKDVNLNIHPGEIYGLISNVNPCRLQLAMVSAGAESLQPSWQNPVCCLQVLALSRVCL